MTNVIYYLHPTELPKPSASGAPGGPDDITITGISGDINSVAAMLHKAGAVPVCGGGPYTLAYATLAAAFNGGTYAVATPASTF